jgi:hypothetical protein
MIGTGEPEAIAMHAELLALVPRPAVLDLSPRYEDHRATLASLEADFVDRSFFIASGKWSQAESFAGAMEDLLRAENAKAPADERAIKKLQELARRARALVFCR